MRLDVLTNNEANFVVDTSGVSAVTPTLTLANQLFLNNAGQGLFQAGDNAKIREVRISAPFQFGQADANHAIGLLFSTLATIPELGGASALTLPNLCDEPFKPDLFIQALGVNYGFVLSSIANSISMIGAPTQLNGQTLRLRYILVVEHTLPMV